MVQQMSPRGRKTQTAAVVSQKNNRSHVRKPPRRPLSAASTRWRCLPASDVEAPSPQVVLPGAVRKPKTHEYQGRSSGGQSWSVVPPPRSEEKREFLMCRAG